MKVLMSLFMALVVIAGVYGGGQSDVTVEKVAEEVDLSSYNYALTVNGMGCSLCAAAVTENLTRLDFVESGYNNGETNIIYLTVTETENDEALAVILKVKVEELGYRFGGLEENS